MRLIRISAIWCTSCILTHKYWLELKEKYDYEFVEYDFDEDEEIIKNYNIGKILPVIIVVNNDKEITRIIGEKNTKEIEKIINDIKE